MQNARRILLFMVLILICGLHVPIPHGHAYSRALIYKNYAVLKDQGRDILCDAYTVQKNDYVIKLFRERGEISQADFPEFLAIFKRLNPHIADVNQIRPGQHIYIPLKKLSKDMLPGQSSGIVTLPFVTVSKASDIIKSYSRAYKIQKGDYVSRLISEEFGTFGSVSYQQGIKLFKLVNPQIADINRIYLDQIVNIPQRSIQEQPWYPRLFDASGNLVSRLTGESRPDATAAPAGSQPDKDQPRTAFHKAAAILDANLRTKGTYFFPRKNSEDFKLDLSRSPVMELKNGHRLLLMETDESTGDHLDINTIMSFWKRVTPVRIPRNSSVDKVLDAVFNALNLGISPAKQISFSDNVIDVTVTARWIINSPDRRGSSNDQLCITLIDHPEEATSDAMCNYLRHHHIVIQDKLRDAAVNAPSAPAYRIQHISGGNIAIQTSDRKSLIIQCAQALGVSYDADVTITFPYAGIQINAVSNLVTRRDGSLFLVDFGDLYGDAVSSIRRSGIDIIQILPGTSVDGIIREFLLSLNLSFTEQPVFYGAERPKLYNSAITIPGFLIAGDNSPDVLFTSAVIAPELRKFLEERHIQVIQIPYSENAVMKPMQ